VSNELDIVDAEVIDGEVIDEPVGTELAVIDHTATVDEKLRFALSLRPSAEHLDAVLTAIEKLHPGLAEPVGKRRSFVLDSLSDAIADQQPPTEPLDMEAELEKPAEWPTAPWMRELEELEAELQKGSEPSRFPHLEGLFRS
jgi:hypothetical protein